MRVLPFVSFMFCHKWVVVIIVFALLTGGCLAYTEQGTGTTATTSGWSWNTYSGVSSWNVRITEDESRCGGGQIYTEEMSVGFKHSGKTAVMSSVGHGAATGTFVSGNVLHFPERIVSDPPGKSRLSDYDLTFTPDCSLFTGGYDWHYNGPTGSCDGYTGLRGYNENKAGCPAQSSVTVVPTFTPSPTPTVTQTNADKVLSMLAQAHRDLTTDFGYRKIVDDVQRVKGIYVPGGDGEGRSPENDFEVGEVNAAITALEIIKITDPQVEAQYKMIFTWDPNNYWANWDMAQLKRNQAMEAQSNEDKLRLFNENEYYLQKVLDNKKLTDDARMSLKEDYTKKYNFGLTVQDSTSLVQYSPIIKKLSTEGSSIQSTDPSQQGLKRWTQFAPSEDVMKIVPTGITK